MRQKKTKETKTIKESDLTKAEVETIHKFGRDWVANYDTKSRPKWKQAFWLWAYDYVPIFEEGRRSVPVGK